MNAGDTFLIVERKVDPHLWIVLSDPAIDPEEVLIVNVTTWSDSEKDTACKLVPGDHTYITHASCIAYARARLCSLEQLVALRDHGLLNMREPVTADLLQLIRVGAAKSKFIELGKREILRRQGLIE